MRLLKFFIVRCIKFLPLKYLKEIFSYSLDKLEKAEDTYVTIHNRPKFIDRVVVSNNSANKGVGIVMQGPVITNNFFTIETLRLYKKQFPDIVIIFVVWSDESENVIDQIKQEGVEIVVCEKPIKKGPFNINFQIIGSRKGVERAKDLGCDYVLKVRSDQRVYRPDFIAHLRNLQVVFPLKSDKIKERLIVSSFTTLKYRPYSVSDMFIFGHIDDMLNYWSAPEDERVNSDFNYKTIKEFTDCRIAEVYLCTEFLINIGEDNLFTLENYWKVLAQYFCVVDHKALDLYWPKYKKELEHRHTYYQKAHSYELVEFSDWLAMYQGNWESYIKDDDLASTLEGAYF